MASILSYNVYIDTRGRSCREYFVVYSIVLTLRNITLFNNIKMHVCLTVLQLYYTIKMSTKMYLFEHMFNVIKYTIKSDP